MGEKLSEKKIESLKPEVIISPESPEITLKRRGDSIGSLSTQNITLSFGSRSTMPSFEIERGCIKPKKSEDLLFTIISEGKKEDNDNKEPTVFMKNNIVILDKEIEENNKMILSDYKGESLHNEQLIINAAGLINSLRQMRDGYVYFGTNKVQNHMIVNDYLIDSLSKCKDRSLFYIKFNRDQRKYYLKTHSNSIFVKLNHKSYTPLSFAKHSKRYIQLGKEIIIFSKKAHSIDVSINHTTFSFDESKVVTIGRHQSCSLYIDSGILSKINCELRYNYQIEQWEICDGYKGKASTNGTWLLCNDKYELLHHSNEEYIKIENCIIKVSKYDESYQSC